MNGLTNLALILVSFCVGYFSSRYMAAPMQLSQRMNFIIVNFAFPAVILRVLPALSLPAEAFFLVLAPWAVIGFVALLVLVISRHLGWSRATLCAALLLATLGNTGFLGYPLISTFFTEEQLGLGIIFDQFGSFIAFCSYATILVTVFSSSGRVTAKDIVLRILRFPPFTALIIALFLPADFFPDAALSLFKFVGWIMVPAIMFSIGLQFRFRTDVDLIQPIAITLGLKMLVAPLLVFSMGLLFGVPSWILDIAIFQAAMPPMVTPAIILIATGLAPRFAAATLGFGLLAGLAYLPILALILKQI